MNTTHPLRAGAIAAAVLCIVLTQVAIAGNVNPPAGAVAPTMKTLDEVEPRIPLNQTNTPGDLDSLYRITQPGSYYLTRDTNVRNGESGIEIVVSNVTIDLMGYRLYGDPSSLHGIDLSLVDKVRIRNGTIATFGGNGINGAGAGHEAIVEHVSAIGNAGKGFFIGSGSHLSQCTARDNVGYGYHVYPGTTLSHCTAISNDTAGFVGTMVADACAAYDNGDDGFRASGVFSHCLANNNMSRGFEVTGAATLDGCRARGNSTDGFYLSNDSCSLTNCLAVSNGGRGFTTANPGPVTYVGCVAEDNSLSGFHAPSGSTLEACVARANGNYGILGGDSLTIRGCSITRNSFDGVSVDSNCLIIANNFIENGFDTGNGGGIRANLSGNRIEGNNLIGNTRGIDVDSADNVIIRNSAHANGTNYTIVPGNIVGPFVDASNVATDTSPHANYDY